LAWRGTANRHIAGTSPQRRAATDYAYVLGPNLVHGHRTSGADSHLGVHSVAITHKTPEQCHRMRAWATLLFLLPMLAGCLSGDNGDADAPAGTVTDAMAAIGTPIGMEHDHNDHSLHTASSGIDFLSWSTLDMTLGDNGFANFVLWSDDDEQLAYVAVDGDHEGGFVVADISDPYDIQVLGKFMIPGSSFQEVRVTPDGRYAVLNVQDLANNQESVEHRSQDEDYCPICIFVVNVEDRTSPVLESNLPVELLGTHNMDFQEQDGELLLYYVGQPLSYTPGSPASQAGNHVYIAKFLEQEGEAAVLVPQGDFRHDNTNDPGSRSFPHDVIVDTHPLTGQEIAYVSHWDGGAITFDVSDPMLPVELDQQTQLAPSDELAIHWFKQEDWVRPDGRVYAWSAPEIGALGSGTGVVRGYDVTNPADVQQISSWELPGAGPDGVFIERAYTMSPHTVNMDPEAGLAAVTHYHAGVWILDISEPTSPQHVAFYQPHGNPNSPYDGPIWWKKPNFDPSGFGPNAYMARWDDRGAETILWVTDRGTGLYALQYTGDIGQPIR
jgi:hypothetical protein